DAPSRAAATAISRPKPGPTPETTSTLSSSSTAAPSRSLPRVCRVGAAACEGPHRPHMVVGGGSAHASPDEEDTMSVRSRLVAPACVAALAVTLIGSTSVSAGTECGTDTGRGCAPLDRRVDLAPPSFSNPTSITNPLFPISDLRSVVLLGHVDGKPFRTETTL